MESEIYLDIWQLVRRLFPGLFFMPKYRQGRRTSSTGPFRHPKEQHRFHWHGGNRPTLYLAFFYYTPVPGRPDA